MTTLAARIRRLPVRVRLTLAGTVLLPLALAIVFGLVFLRFEAGLNATIDGDLRARANAVSIMLRREGPQALQGAAAQELLGPLGAFAQVVDRSGRVLASTDAVAHVRLLTTTQAAAATTDGVRTERSRIPHVAKRSRLVAVPLPGGRSALVAGRSLKDREGANESFGRALLIGGPLALVLAAAACYLASAAALRPVETMRRRAAEITGTEPSARLPVPATNDEIARLGETLNDMIARLENALVRQRELTQNASHELRTPLTVLTAEIELALGHDLDAATRAAITTALEEARRVSRLADDLLTLAQVEEQTLPLAIEAVDLDEIVRAAAARAARGDRARGRAIVVDSQTLIAQADPSRIEQALGNLLDNALVHGQGTVSVTLRDEGDRIQLAVHDEGPGFPDDLRAIAFDRFTRAANRPRHGAGLGLAIVKAIADAHGGHAGLGGDHPSSVVLTLPHLSPDWRVDAVDLTGLARPLHDLRHGGDRGETTEVGP
jgi:two-component system OmpR family sensor kinase